MKNLVFCACFCACLLCSTTSLWAQDFCPLVVKVVLPDGTEEKRPKPVTVEEENGRKIERRYTAGGVRFCDLGIKAVTLTVGFPGCNQVIVRNVPLKWYRTMTSTVISDGESCSIAYARPFQLECELLFRFVDSQQRPLPGASLELQKPFERNLAADEFGRAYVRVRFRQELSGTAVASGFKPVPLRLTCTNEVLRSEHFVTMHPVD